MSRFLRPRAPGAPIFFTVRLRDTASDLLRREVAALREAVMVERLRRPFHIDAFVVLPDHLHCLWTLPPDDTDCAVRWQAIKAEFSRRVAPRVPSSPGKRRRGQLGIWKRGYWQHPIRDARDYRTHLHYCWADPVQHGLCDRAADWEFSSFHREVRQGWVEANWVGKPPEGRFGEVDEPGCLIAQAGSRTADTLALPASAQPPSSGPAGPPGGGS